MAGLYLNTGLGTSVFGSGYGAAATPAAAGASPQGPTTIGQKAFGITTGSGSGMYSCAHIGLISGGTFALAALLFIYYSLPR
jgi:hypothetical protein